MATHVPLFSIVTACKITDESGFEFFGATLKGVLAQSFSDWEWIIVDDASARSIAEAFDLKDPRIRVIQNDQGRGQTWSLNLGIREARSDWIVRVDGDDLLSPRRLEATRDALEGAKLVFSDYRVIDEDGTWIADMILKKPLGSAFFNYLRGRNNPICHPTVAFLRRDTNGEILQYREDLKNAQDYELWKRILSQFGESAFRCVSELLVDYRLVASSLSGARAHEQKDELDAIRTGREVEPVTQSQALGGREREAMHAFRVLYYRFASAKQVPWSRSDLSLLRKAVAHRPVVTKAVAYFLLRGLGTPSRRALFR